MTEQEFWNLIYKKAESEFNKGLIRSTYPSHIAEPMCNAIDSKDKAELLDRLHKEWLEYQKRQSDIIQILVALADFTGHRLIFIKVFT